MSAASPPPRAYGKLAKRGLVWGFAREGTRSLILIPTAMATARLLTPEETGTAAAAYFVMQLGSRLTQFGLGVSLVRAKTITDAHTASAFVLSLVLGLGMWLALVAGGSLAGRLLGSVEAGQLLPIAGLGFVVGAFGSVPTALLSRDMRYKESATSEWLSTLVASGTVILFAWLGYGPWSIVYSALLSDATRAGCRAWMSRWIPSVRFSKAAMGDMFSFGMGVYFRNLLEYCAQNIDNLIVGRVLGMEALGYYDKAFSFVTKISAKINLSGPSVSFRAFSVMQDEAQRFRRAYRKVILSAAFVGFPFAAGMVVMAHELVMVMFGSRWLPAVQPFRILCIAVVLRLINTYASSATQAKGYIWSEVRRQIVAVTTLVIAVLAFSHWGITGAAAGVLVATLVSTVLLQMLVRDLTGMTWRDLVEPQVPGLVCAATVAALLFIARGAMVTAWPQLSAVAVLASSVALAGCIVVAFALFAPFSDMREVTQETAKDLGLEPWLQRLSIRLSA